MTEKNYNPKQKEKKAMNKQKKIKDKPVTRMKTEEEKLGTPKNEKKKEIIKKPKKTEAIVNSVGLPISTKVSVSICKFIRGKKIESAISYLEQVKLQKKAIPMKGEIPHRKGKIMSGRYPKKASEYFIRLLKSLLANANFNNLNSPIITKSVANVGSRPFGRFGRVRRKRTNITLKAEEKK